MSTSTSSILSPAIDFFCVGGLSLIVFVPLLLSGRSDLVWIGAGAQAWIATLINMPHFMASYRIVYRSREMILRHKWATIYVPAIMIVYSVLALWTRRARRSVNRRCSRSCSCPWRARTSRGTTRGRCGE